MLGKTAHVWVSVATVALGLMLRVGVCEQTCYDSLKNANIIPDYAGDVSSTNMTLCSEYTPMQCGEVYAPSLLEKRPTCYFTPPAGCDYLAILFFGKHQDDTNATLLWFVYNIPAEEIRTGFTGQDGNEMVIYKSPKTSSGSPSEYVFFVYCQDSEMASFYCCGPDQRPNFAVKDFAASRGFGDPVAAINFGVTAAGQLMNSTDYSGQGGACPRKT